MHCRYCNAKATVYGGKVLCSKCGATEFTLAECINRWVIWYIRNNALTMGLKLSALGRVIDTVKHKLCPRCLGRTKVKSATGYTKCGLCKGKGRIRLDRGNAINPAFIHGTGGDSNIEPYQDEIAQEINALLKGMHPKTKNVFIVWYTEEGKATEKAHRLTMSMRTFFRRKHEALNYLGSHLTKRS